MLELERWLLGPNWPLNGCRDGVDDPEKLPNCDSIAHWRGSTRAGNKPGQLFSIDLVGRRSRMGVPTEGGRLQSVYLLSSLR